MQILSPYKGKGKDHVFFLKTFVRKQASCCSPPLPSGVLDLPIIISQLDSPLPLQAWEGRIAETLKSTQIKLFILTDEELRLGEMKVFSKNANLVAKLVR